MQSVPETQYHSQDMQCVRVCLCVQRAPMQIAARCDALLGGFSWSGKADR